MLDATGVEDRLTNAFTTAVMPTLTDVFPAVGASAGGTEIVLSGTNFVSGATVRIGGVTQSSITVESSDVLRFTTLSGTPGGPYTLEVENPGGAIATSAFAYVAQPDPVVASLTPATGEAAGGETVRITGSGFTANTMVVFDADPETGTGGVAAARGAKLAQTTARSTLGASANPWWTRLTRSLLEGTGLPSSDTSTQS